MVSNHKHCMKVIKRQNKICQSWCYTKVHRNWRELEIFLHADQAVSLYPEKQKRSYETASFIHIKKRYNCHKLSLKKKQNIMNNIHKRKRK